MRTRARGSFSNKTFVIAVKSCLTISVHNNTKVAASMMESEGESNTNSALCHFSGIYMVSLSCCTQYDNKDSSSSEIKDLFYKGDQAKKNVSGELVFKIFYFGSHISSLKLSRNSSIMYSRVFLLNLFSHELSVSSLS